MDTIEKIMESALRSIMAGAISLEAGHENPREAAQDIQKLCLCALKGEVLPQIWEPWNTNIFYDEGQ